ncbi:hypothetical protein BC739_005640 [Kutzneria viridogrisea]|uniref:Uncharacterized protein n=1 Tax=Kutzneria viridogrisea TaxID=47990 RepID=A0ABR6BND7_9PSEU|nr:hypothetical protein [Kutzneria viridogrisea]
MKVPFETLNVLKGTFMTGTTYAPQDLIVTEAIAAHNVMKVPFTTLGVPRGPFMAVGRASLRATFTARGAGAPEA